MLSPDAREQEYLLHALDGARGIASQRELFLWSQGALQTLLPHGVLLCVQLDEQGRPRKVECLSSTLLAPSLLCDPAQGPVPAWLRQWQQGGGQPLALRAGELGHGLIHGSGALAAGGSAFALLGLPGAAGLREGWLLQVLLPYLHLAAQRIASAAWVSPAGSAMSPRQTEILQWLREGKSNEEIGRLLGISALTVKNHLQRLYRQLGVNNRAHAVARSIA
ncbi:LuxR C-terminal-related transcriptional regulator, partial [Pseudoduganella violaceinigra]|uniref:LuxR C-terminal-related transcriptional regulator n=1 Tax=Pseudoduganella violaceinigra TaxID=246602 RepID=UPI000429B8DB